MSDTASVSQRPSAAKIGLWLGPLWVILCLLLPAPAEMSATAWACVGF
ncbi:hypothetical protein J8402_07150 [Chromohalobacter israelensis]